MSLSRDQLSEKLARAKPGLGRKRRLSYDLNGERGGRIDGYQITPAKHCHIAIEFGADGRVTFEEGSWEI
ncbi:MAG: hypothetical protein ACI9BW_003533 [Gammaproteobacteria bacterium]|jgi:hypothetical protein